jgi:hypothetical protein
MKNLIPAVACLLLLTAAVAAQKVGGYKEVSVSDAYAHDAAVFAAHAQGEKIDRTIKLLKINKAEMQVVAGRNYRMCLKVQSSGAEDEADAIFTVLTVVYVDLKGNKKLTSWEPGDCGDDDDDD